MALVHVRGSLCASFTFPLREYAGAGSFEDDIAFSVAVFGCGCTLRPGPFLAGRLLLLLLRDELFVVFFAQLMELLVGYDWLHGGVGGGFPLRGAVVVLSP